LTPGLSSERKKAAVNKTYPDHLQVIDPDSLMILLIVIQADSQKYQVEYWI
jgi:hypothetical protein